MPWKSLSCAMLYPARGYESAAPTKRGVEGQYSPSAHPFGRTPPLPDWPPMGQSIPLLPLVSLPDPDPGGGPGTGPGRGPGCGPGRGPGSGPGRGPGVGPGKGPGPG